MTTFWFQTDIVETSLSLEKSAKFLNGWLWNIVHEYKWVAQGRCRGPRTMGIFFCYDGSGSNAWTFLVTVSWDLH